MPLRERMRKAFGRKTSSDELTPKRTKSQKAVLYQAGEPMPRPKYPGRYDKPHQELLHAFTFGDASKRRRSAQTEISPMASRAPSRKNSAMDTAARHVGQPPRRNMQVMDRAASDQGSTVALFPKPNSERGAKQPEHDPQNSPRPKPTTDGIPTSNGSASMDRHDLSAALKQSSLRMPPITGYC
ncbi:MAG: hypothetical protein M1838_000191 [Thelocarpon superellum]|nr:MAG: hypothetical protein M1838_000191 [Thelocarpon superellum]